VDELERALKAALRREPAPKGFSDRILRRANSRCPAASWWRAPAMRWALASAVVASSIAGVVSEHILRQRRLEQVRGEQARQQVLTALRITGTKLRVVQSQISRTAGEGKEQ
jgi:hypothetical protein